MLPGYLPWRYEVVVGLTEAAARRAVDEVRGALNGALAGMWVCGSRVVTRQRLKRIDPGVFADHAGTLRVGGKGRLRELGKDPRTSSDLDIKILVRAGALDERARGRLARDLGVVLEDLDPHIPVSGHVRPVVQLLEVPAECAGARAAFDDYNARRMALLGKGRLSLEYVQLLYDPAAADPDEVFGAGAVRAAIRARMVPAPAAPGPQLGPPADKHELGRRLRTVIDEVSVHQWIGALADEPGLVPRRLLDGSDDERRLLGWAVGQARGRAVSERGTKA